MSIPCDEMAEMCIQFTEQQAFTQKIRLLGFKTMIDNKLCKRIQIQVLCLIYILALYFVSHLSSKFHRMAEIDIRFIEQQSLMQKINMVGIK